MSQTYIHDDKNYVMNGLKSQTLDKFGEKNEKTRTNVKQL